MGSVCKTDKGDSLKKRLKKELNWYTLYASKEEYDEKAVKSILYLLDTWDPLDEEDMPDVDEEWEKFQKIAERRELLPLSEAVSVPGAGPMREARLMPAGVQEAGDRLELDVAAKREARLMSAGVQETGDVPELDRAVMRENGPVPVGVQETEDVPELDRVVMCENGPVPVGVRQVESMPASDNAPLSECASAAGRNARLTENLVAVKDFGRDGDLVQEEKSASGKSSMADTENHGDTIPSELPEGSEKSGKTAAAKRNRVVAFAMRHKAVVAAALVLMIFAVGNSIHAVANPDTGFFFWLERDDSGVEMMTVPEEFTNMTDIKGKVVYSGEEVPEWGQEWLQIEDAVEVPQDYQWRYFEVNDLLNRKILSSSYFNSDRSRQIVLGVLNYLDKASYYREEFTGYSYVESYEGVDEKVMDVYSREEAGEIFYIISFYEGNCKYFVNGQKDLEELKGLAEEYWKCVQKFF